LAVTQPRLVVI